MSEVVPPVWIGIITKPITQQREAVPARGYQTDAYYAFMKGTKNEPLHIDKSNGIIFDIFPFDGDKDKYPRFCIFQNVNKERSILSDNKEALDAYIKADEQARINKALKNAQVRRKETQNQHYRSSNSTYANSIRRGGNRTKRSRKIKRSKRSKRMHTSKRK
jgi:hypothetical protein